MRISTTRNKTSSTLSKTNNGDDAKAPNGSGEPADKSVKKSAKSRKGTEKAAAAAAPADAEAPIKAVGSDKSEEKPKGGSEEKPKGESEKPAKSRKGAKKAEAVASAAPADAEAPIKAVGSEEADESKKKPKKPMKKTIPKWASLSPEKVASLGVPSAQTAVELIQEAIKTTANNKGVASSVAIKKFVAQQRPNWSKMVFKNSLLKGIREKKIIQVKGKGISGSFKNNLAQKSTSSSSTGKKKMAQKIETNLEPLDNIFPNIFTWVCEPKEASFQLIRKYITKHYPNLHAEGNALKRAVESGVSKGQLERITGKGSSGTFQLIDGAKKSGTRYEDAIEDAIIAMNEPKEASVQALKHYLSEFHLEYNIPNRPSKLKNALDRCQERGWIQQITGKGFSGTFRLSFPYYPNPKELWGEWYKEREQQGGAKKRQRNAHLDSDESEESSDESEEKIIPVKKKQGNPQARKSGPARSQLKKKSSKTLPKKRRR